MKLRKPILIVTFVISLIPTLTFSQNSQWFTKNKIKEYNLKSEVVKVDINTDVQEKLKNINLVANNNKIITSNIKIDNAGSSDALIRVLVFPRVIDTNNKNIINQINLEDIRIEYYNEVLDRPDENYWHIGDDGYMYYKGILKKGESLTEKFLKDVKINISKEDIEKYENKYLSVDIVVEAVQARNNAYEGVWNL